MGGLEALPVEGGCETRPGQPKINDPSVAEVTLLGLLVARTGLVASHARLWLGTSECRQIVRPLGLVTECAFEGMDGVPEPEARCSGARILPLDLGCGRSIVAGSAGREVGVELGLDARSSSAVAGTTIGEEHRVLLMGETLLSPESRGTEYPHQHDGRSGQKDGASHRFPLPTSPGSFPMGISRVRLSRA